MLTPREIYRWLSNGIDGDKSTAAIRLSKTTLIHFWRELLMTILDDDSLAMLDSTKEKRSRSLSNIMNRSGTAGVMSPLYETFSKELNSAKFMHLTVAWLEVLNRQEPDWFLFMESLCAFEDQCIAGDSAITSEIQDHLETMRDEANEAFEMDYPSQGFFCSVQMAWLTVYAFLGSHMDSKRIALLRKRDEFSASQLYMKYRHVTFGRFVPVVLTSHECEACKQALAQEAYVPCPENVVDLLYERLEKNGKVLISGAGGMGKTELVRQVLVRCGELGRYSRLAFAQDQGDLVSAFQKAFLELREEEPGEVLRSVGELLDKPYSGRTLLVIDNARIDRNPEQWEKVACFGCDVLVTSRQRELEGFSEFPMAPLGVDETRKLLEVSSGFPLSDSRKEFEQLHCRVQGHPLAVILLGKALKMRSLTVAALNEEIDANGYQNLQLIHRGESESFIEKLRKVFASTIVTPQMRRLLVLFSAMDTVSWPPRNVENLLLDAEPDTGKVPSILYNSYLNGWLELNQHGYSMQPVIAEAMRTEFGTLRDHPKLEKRIRELFAQHGDELFYYKRDAYAGASIVSFLLGNGMEVPEEIALGAMVYAEIYGYSQIRKRMVRFCRKSSNKETRFIAWCFEYTDGMAQYESAGEENDAAALMKEAEKIDFANPLAAMGVLAFIRLSNSFGNKKINELISRILEKCPNSIPRGFILIEEAQNVLVNSGDVMKCNELLTQAEKMDPEQKSFCFQFHLQAFYSLRLGVPALDTEHIDKLEQLAEKIKEMGNGTAKKDSWIFCAYMMEAFVYSRQWQRVETYAQRYIEEYMKNADDSLKNDKDELFHLAQAYRRVKQPMKALEVNYQLLRKIKRLDRSSWLTLHALDQRGYAYYEAGKYRQSLQVLEECLKRMNECEQPDEVGRVTIHFQIAMAYDAMNKKDKAQEYIDAVLEKYKAMRERGFFLMEELEPMLAYVHES